MTEPTGPHLAQDRVRIELEDAGDGAWWRRILATMFTQYGQQHLRFVARPVGTAGRDHPVATGSTFASARWIKDTAPEPEWAPDMARSLREVRDDLERAGWRAAGHGPEPWSYDYVRQPARSPFPTAGPSAQDGGAR